MKILLPSSLARHQARVREVILFVGVGVLNTAVDFAVLNLLIRFTHHEDGWWLLAFNGLSFLAAVINSYVLNGRFTFRNNGPGDPWRFTRFVVVNAGGLVINSVTVWSMSPLVGHVLPIIAAINVSKALATAFSLCWNYFAIKRWIFRTETLEITNIGGDVVEAVSVTIGGKTHNEI
jgi:putative flippase GtrA